jgi:subtilisin family serine protease
MIRKAGRLPWLGALLFGGTLAFTSVGVAAPAQGLPVPGQYVVLTAAGVDPAEVVVAHGLAARHTFRAAVNGFAGPVPGNKLAGLRDDPRVLVVEQERIYVLEVQELPSGIDRIEADRNPTANGVTVDLDVAIIDTGIDRDHPDLHVAGGRNFAGGSSSGWDDGNGHGTHVAGTVGAMDNEIGVVGVAPGVRLWAVKVCKNGGICMTGDIVAGINWVAERKAEANDGGADGDAGIDFASANMSISTADDANLCTSNSSAVHQAICGLVNQGVVFALAAGNDGRQKAAFPEVLAVSAIADFDGMAGAAGISTCRSDQDDTLADFSNFGPTVDLAAPGVCILSTWNDGGYNTISGTSMATPHVAGAVALFLHANRLAPAQDAAGVDTIEAAILAAALPQSHECGYTNEQAGEGSVEPLLFVHALAFGGDGSCDVAGGSDEAPLVTINQPADGATFDSGAAIDFSGSAGDTEDGDLTAELVWTSDLDGQIGTGGSFSATLSDGTHTISAEVTDSGGLTGSDSVSVMVGAVAEGVTVTAIEPSSMQAGITVDVIITGTGFAAGTEVTFENGSGPAPAASVTSVSADGTTITATVTARSAGPPRNRVWDVRVTNPDGSSGVLVDGFTVTP